MNLIQDMDGEKAILDGVLLTAEQIEQQFCINEEPVYEVIRVIDGIPLFFEDHMQRMRNTCKLIGLSGLPEESTIKNLIAELCKANGTFYHNVKLIACASKTGLTMLAYLLQTAYPPLDSYLAGVTTDVVRRERNNPTAKILDVEYKEDMHRIMTEMDAYELLLVNEEGLITEGSRSNVFFIKGNNVITAEAELVLAGITRSHVIEACKMAGASVQEKALSTDKLGMVDAVFMSGTSPRVLPISSIGSNSYKSADNPLLQAIANKYDAMIREYIEARGGRTSFEADSI